MSGIVIDGLWLLEEVLWAQTLAEQGWHWWTCKTGQGTAIEDSNLYKNYRHLGKVEGRKGGKRPYQRKSITMMCQTLRPETKRNQLKWTQHLYMGIFRYRYGCKHKYNN